jgi:hypothetical protein
MSEAILICVTTTKSVNQPENGIPVGIRFSHRIGHSWSVGIRVWNLKGNQNG